LIDPDYGGREQSAIMKIEAFVRCFCFGLLLTSLCTQTADGDQAAVQVIVILTDHRPPACIAHMPNCGM
jgi:hypothetical protein